VGGYIHSKYPDLLPILSFYSIYLSSAREGVEKHQFLKKKGGYVEIITSMQPLSRGTFLSIRFLIVPDRCVSLESIYLSSHGYKKEV
jgi:hypothetical protein